MENTLEGLPVKIYIDDILIEMEIEEDGLEMLKEVLVRLKNDSFKIGFKKCAVLKKRVEYLGFELTQDGRKVKKEYWSDLKDPKDVLEAEAVIGKLEYVRGNIKNFAAIVKRAHALKKGLREKNPNKRGVITHNRPLTIEEKGLMQEVKQKVIKNQEGIKTLQPGGIELKILLCDEGGWIEARQNDRLIGLESMT